MFHKYESFTCPKVMVGYARSCRTFCDQHDEILNGIIVMAVARTLIGGCLFIYSCSARLVSFEIKFNFINLKRN